MCMGSFFVYASTHQGLDAIRVRVEIDISPGLPRFTIVGLPDAAVSESRERVRAAIRNCGFTFPRTRVTVNLAPADVRKQGPAFDLAIAVGILAASDQLTNVERLRSCVLMGELALDGGLQRIEGALLASLMCKEQGMASLVVPEENAIEAALVQSTQVHPMKSLTQLVIMIEREEPLPVAKAGAIRRQESTSCDLADVRGQEQAKRALMIAAAGGHNLMLCGPPGSGKTMLARAAASILPSLSEEERLELTKIHSIAGRRRTKTTLVTRRPFRSPHHTASSVALIGGGAWPRPGEVSLAHRGVLFLDEFPEFARKTIENLRQPLEDGFVTIARAASTLRFPADFMLIAAMNPCPCGFVNDQNKACTCRPHDIQRYQQKLSGPLMDRIDLYINVPRINYKQLTGTGGATSGEVQSRVEAARARQKARFASDGIATNSELNAGHLKAHCALGEKESKIMKKAVDVMHLSARAYARTLKVARTIADLDKKEVIEVPHLTEALQYRP